VLSVLSSPGETPSAAARRAGPLAAADGDGLAFRPAGLLAWPPGLGAPLPLELEPAAGLLAAGTPEKNDPASEPAWLPPPAPQPATTTAAVTHPAASPSPRLPISCLLVTRDSYRLPSRLVTDFALHTLDGELPVILQIEAVM
jgi:hypothetical protein